MVPSTAPVSVSWVALSSNSFTMPKSASFGRGGTPGVSRTFAGLRSRWTMRAPWTQSSAAASSTSTGRSTSPPAPTRRPRLPPEVYWSCGIVVKITVSSIGPVV
jgi:hypothetical protein